MKSRETLYSPIAHTLVGAVLELAGMAMVSSDASVLPVFAVTMVYGIASPILIAFRRFWFVNAILTTVGMFALLALVPPLGAMLIGHKELGEAAMLLMLPIMIFPCALVLSGVVRLVMVYRERAAAKASTAAA